MSSKVDIPAVVGAELRLQAEEIPREKAGQLNISLESLAPEEILKMLHDLQQYQVELELQNGELRRTKAELETARTVEVERLANEQRIIISSMPTGLCFLKDRKIQLANPAFDLSFGYEIGTTKGMDTLKFYPDIETYERLGNDAYAWLADGASYAAESLMKRKDGSLFWCSLTGQAVNPAKPEEGSIWLLQDISERKSAEQNLLESNRLLMEAREEAESASRAKSDFLSRMSHELRTPMNAIMGFTQLLEDDRNHYLSDDQRDNLHEISRAGTHLLELINEVLDLSRIESGRLLLSLEPLEPGELCLECLSLLMPLAEQHGITVVVKVPSGLRIQADRLRLRQVLLNLISNGIKYNSEGGSVDIGCELLPNNLLRIWVRDTGPGIGPEFLPRLFQPFERVSEDDWHIEGAGIGLALAKRLTEAMNGSIGVESKPGNGSLFWIELPQAELMEEMEASPDAPTVPVPVPSARERQVLYIEDNPANMRLVKKIMSGLGGVSLLTA